VPRPPGRSLLVPSRVALGASSSVDITINPPTPRISRRQRRRAKAMDGVPESEVATNLDASQSVVQVKVDRAKPSPLD